jgi:excisionase family DNA binding protein
MSDHQLPARPALLTVAEAAACAGVARQTVYGWLARGRLRPVPTDDGDRVCAADLADFLAARRAAGAAGVRVETVLAWSHESAADAGA